MSTLPNLIKPEECRTRNGTDLGIGVSTRQNSWVRTIIIVYIYSLQPQSILKVMVNTTLIGSRYNFENCYVLLDGNWQCILLIKQLNEVERMVAQCPLIKPWHGSIGSAKRYTVQRRSDETLRLTLTIKRGNSLKQTVPKMDKSLKKTTKERKERRSVVESVGRNNTSSTRTNLTRPDFNEVTSRQHHATHPTLQSASTAQVVSQSAPGISVT